MVDKNFVDQKKFIAYLDDDGTQKNQWVIIISKDDFGIEFKYNLDEDQTIFIPWTRVLKIKGKEMGE